MISRVYSKTTILLTVFFLIVGCAGSGSLGGQSGNERVYAKSYDRMKNIVEDAIRKSNLSIITISESEGEQKVNFLITEGRYANNTGGEQQHRGEVTVSAVTDSESRVKIENPEYHYTVPDHEKEDYQRQLFSQLEKYEKKEKTSSD